jgi:hypothetical protein
MPESLAGRMRGALRDEERADGGGKGRKRIAATSARDRRPRNDLDKCPKNVARSNSVRARAERLRGPTEAGRVTRKSLRELVRLQRAIGVGGDAGYLLDGEMRGLFVS